MKILITGGSGYIARNLRRLLVNKGHSVFAPSHSELDLLDEGKLRVYLRENQFEAIIHTAVKGGSRNGSDTFENTYIPNMLMFENICGCRPNPDVPIITFGSGAEFDRRSRIRDEYASSILHCWPIDPYGLSKNIITRRAITYMKDVWVLRLFGCFNYDEANTRFIKSCIRNILENKPIIVHQNRTMDFFYLDDIVPVLDRIFSESLVPRWPVQPEYSIPRNMNLTYSTKLGLVGIAQRIASLMGKPQHEITIVEPTGGNDYTGSASILAESGIPLVGFQEGLRRTIDHLTNEPNLLY